MQAGNCSSTKRVHPNRNSNKLPDTKKQRSHTSEDLELKDLFCHETLPSSFRPTYYVFNSLFSYPDDKTHQAPQQFSKLESFQSCSDQVLAHIKNDRGFNQRAFEALLLNCDNIEEFLDFFLKCPQTQKARGYAIQFMRRVLIRNNSLGVPKKDELRMQIIKFLLATCRLDGATLIDLFCCTVHHQDTIALKILMTMIGFNEIITSYFLRNNNCTALQYALAPSTPPQGLEKFARSPTKPEFIQQLTGA
jgi:hypothetical protein